MLLQPDGDCVLATRGSAVAANGALQENQFTRNPSEI